MPWSQDVRTYASQITGITTKIYVLKMLPILSWLVLTWSLSRSLMFRFIGLYWSFWLRLVLQIWDTFLPFPERSDTLERSCCTSWSSLPRAFGFSILWACKLDCAPPVRPGSLSSATGQSYSRLFQMTHSQWNLLLARTVLSYDLSYFPRFSRLQHFQHRGFICIAINAAIIHDRYLI